MNAAQRMALQYVLLFGATGVSLPFAGLWLRAHGLSGAQIGVVLAAPMLARIITGPLLAALLLGIADVAGKYYIPKLGAFIIYSLMIVILVWRPQGLFVRKGGKA